MIESHTAHTVISHSDYGWQATHSNEQFGGPRSIHIDKDCLVQDVRFYIDDLSDEMAAPGRFKACRKGGSAVVSSKAHFPFGGQVNFAQTCRYASNHVRISFDMNWRAGSTVRRHLGLGSFFLPGKWERYFCVPPCQHLAEGGECGWHSIPDEPAGSGMVGHWHRPPLALIFERPDGTRLEVGTGSDVWRWERNFGFGPEAASYKIMVEADGLRVIREPLMICEEVAPEKGQYRFTWYMAWSAPGMKLPDRFDPGEVFNGDVPDDDSVLKVNVDFRNPEIPEHCRRLDTFGGGDSMERSGGYCWASTPMQKNARRVIRQLASARTTGELTLLGVQPGVCWDPVHLARARKRLLPHWDMDCLLDFAVWTRQQLGRNWRIQTLRDDDAIPSPAREGLFGLNGFSLELDDPDV